MRVLQLCHKPPLPKIDGGCIAIFNLSEGLNQKCDVFHMLTLSTEKHPFIRSAYAEEFLNATQLDAVFVDTRVNIIDAFSALVTADSYNVSRFFSPDFDRMLEQRLKQNPYDIIQLESLFMTPYISTIRRNSHARIVLRSHNLEHLIWERLANTAGNQAKKLYLKHLASKLKKYEKRTINEVDGIAAISFEDTKRFQDFKCSVPLITIPFGVDLEKYPDHSPADPTPLKLFHLGAMNWSPNLEAIHWFLDDIWPGIEDLPVELHLAGRGMPESIKKQSSAKLIVQDEVESAIQFMQQFDVMLVPLLSGSGMRVKIIEGMALGKIVITTRVGAEGIDYVDGKHLLIADTPEKFRSHIRTLCENPVLLKTISRNARKLAEEKYDNQNITDKLISFYHSLNTL